MCPSCIGVLRLDWFSEHISILKILIVGCVYILARILCQYINYWSQIVVISSRTLLVDFHPSSFLLFGDEKTVDEIGSLLCMNYKIKLYKTCLNELLFHWNHATASSVSVCSQFYTDSVGVLLSLSHTEVPHAAIDIEQKTRGLQPASLFLNCCIRGSTPHARRIHSSPFNASIFTWQSPLQA